MKRQKEEADAEAELEERNVKQQFKDKYKEGPTNRKVFC